MVYPIPCHHVQVTGTQTYADTNTDTNTDTYVDTYVDTYAVWVNLIARDV